MEENKVTAQNEACEEVMSGCAVKEQAAEEVEVTGGCAVEEQAAEEGAEIEDSQAKERKSFKQFFSARKVATLAMFTALAFCISLLDFPVFPQASFLKLDFSNVFVMLVGFAFGPIEAVIVCVLKELLHIPLGTTGGVGELANICMGCAYILIPATAYYFKKRFWVAAVSLACGTLLQTAVALVCNRFITFPLFMGAGAAGAFQSLYYFIIFFNLIKGTAISVICIVLYKYLSKALKKLRIK